MLFRSVAKVPSHLKNVVVLFGGVGTAHQTVALITGRSELIAMLGTHVVVAFFNIQVAREDNNVEFIQTTVNAQLQVASHVWVAFVTNQEY